MDRLFHLELDPVTHDEQAFFKAMGARIAQLRKDSGITQVQLAKTMDVSQQTVASWESGRRGVPVSALPTLARALGTDVQSLVGEKTQPAKRGPTRSCSSRWNASPACPRRSSAWSCRCSTGCSPRRAAKDFHLQDRAHAGAQTTTPSAKAGRCRWGYRIYCVTEPLESPADMTSRFVGSRGHSQLKERRFASSTACTSFCRSTAHRCVPLSGEASLANANEW